MISKKDGVPAWAIVVIEQELHEGSISTRFDVWATAISQREAQSLYADLGPDLGGSLDSYIVETTWIPAQSRSSLMSDRRYGTSFLKDPTGDPAWAVVIIEGGCANGELRSEFNVYATTPSRDAAENLLRQISPNLTESVLDAYVWQTTRSDPSLNDEGASR